MSALTAVERNVLCITLLALFWVFYGFRHMWNLPLRHGHGFFLGVEVSPGFYEGPGIPWLKSYRTLMVGLFVAWAAALALIILLGRWDMTDTWAGGGALLLIIPLLTFTAWTRHKLGANPPVLSGVAAPLETRRLGDYISWPMETLAAAVIAFSWWLLLRHSGTHIDWQLPLTDTWIALGLLPGKIILVRNSFPLPPERTEEHHQYQDAARRVGVRLLAVFGWGFVMYLAVYAVKHSSVAAHAASWLSWIFVAIQLAPWFVLVAVVILGGRELATMGRGLRPAGNWATPFRPARRMVPGYLTWFVVWFGGTLALNLFRFH
jgi:hypothetical protein